MTLELALEFVLVRTLPGGCACCRGRCITMNLRHDVTRWVRSVQATNSDELSLTENEMLEVIAEGNGDGWLKVRTGTSSTRVRTRWRPYEYTMDTACR